MNWRHFFQFCLMNCCENHVIPYNIDPSLRLHFFESGRSLGRERSLRQFAKNILTRNIFEARRAKHFTSQCNRLVLSYMRIGRIPAALGTPQDIEYGSRTTVPILLSIETTMTCSRIKWRLPDTDSIFNHPALFS